jgi:hypothetical protein
MCWLDLNLNQRNTISFAKNHHLDKEMVNDGRNGTLDMWTCKGASMQTQDSCKKSLCFKSDLIPWNSPWVQICTCFLLWKAIIIGLGRPCAKSSNWGKSLGCQYYTAHGSKMYVEVAKLRINWLFSDVLIAAISFVCQLLANYLTHDSNET